MTGADGGPNPFSARTEAWQGWQGSPWGRLRYAVVRETTARATADLRGPLRVLDVGGGDGADSISMAVDGHQVTVLDFAPELLEQAERAAAAQGVADHVRTVCADLDSLLAGPVEEIARASFDVVLCHNVLQYRSDVPATVRLLVSLVRVGGLLSVMAPNPAMDVLAAAVRRMDPERAEEVLDAPTIRGETFDHDMRRLEAEEVEEALTESGCEVERRFGIRCVMDLIADDARKAEPAFYAQLRDLELRLCEREPFLRTARFWQLAARRLR